MNSTAPKPNADRELSRITEGLDDPTDEITGVREVRRTREATLAHIGFPGRPERSTSFEKTPMERLAYELEVQIDQWAQQRMLKTEVIGGATPERQEAIERILRECQAKNKIEGFDAYTNENDKKVSYIIYYNQRHS